MPGWTILGEGTFNVAHVNEDKTLVLKIQKGHSNTDLPERSVRLWNEINEKYPPPAQLYIHEGHTGWTCPFIKGKQASDSEISTALLDIFNLTGRVIIDAYVPGNFIKNQTGNIVCIDIGMALQLQKREEDLVHQNKTRRFSMTSRGEWDGFFKQAYNGKNICS